MPLVVACRRRQKLAQELEWEEATTMASNFGFSTMATVRWVGG